MAIAVSDGFFIGTKNNGGPGRPPHNERKNVLREPTNNTTSTDCQTTQRLHHHPIRGHYFAEAERHLGMAVDLIEKGRSDSATVPMKTCALMLDLLAGIRTPLRRLGSIKQEAAFIGAPSFELEPNEVGR